jgi:hypothetical protein
VSDQLLDKADALMHRRNFVADAKTVEEPLETADEVYAEDFPLLTEVVAEGQDLSPQPQDATAPSASSLFTQQLEAAVREQLNRLLEERQTQLANEIETWLDEQMPQLVIRAMDGITDHLVALLANRTRDELLPRLEAAMQHADDGNADSTE